MNKINYFTVSIIVCIAITGCATLSKEECLQGDWRSIGYRDGTRGYTLDRFKEHQKACADFQISPDLSAYQAGRDEGLTVYCSPQNGFKLGEQVEDYHGVCPANLETTFLEQYKRGLQTAQRFNQQDIARYKEEQREQTRLLFYIEDVEKLKKVKEKINKQKSDLDRLREKDRKITRLLEKARGIRR